MATRIVIKNSTIGGKVPAAGDLVNAELALNLTDRKLYSKDAAGNVFEIGGGEGAQVPGGPTPPNTGNEIGDLFFDTVNNTLLYWDGSQWVPIAGDEALALDDLTDVEIVNPAVGELLVWNGSEWTNDDPGYLTEAEVNNILNGLNPDGSVPDGGAEEYAKLDDIKDGKLTIKDADDNILGEFTANQETDTEVSIPAAKWEDIEGNPITIGGTQPGNPSLGDIWVDTSQCPPVLNIWDDCEDPGNPTWTPIGGGVPPAPALTVNTPTLTAPTVCTGDTVTCSAGSANGGTPPYTFTYVFSNDDGVVQDSASPTYVLQETDEGKSITCVVHVVDGAAEEADSAVSNAIGPVDPCLTLTVGKGDITPKIDLEEGDTLTGTASVVQAVNPVETHVWELDGSEIQRGSSATYVAAAGVVRYRKEVTDDNNVSAVIGEWSDPVTVAEVIDDTVPNADMNGLRFDSARETDLVHSGSAPNNAFTSSFWVKINSKSLERIFTIRSNPGSDNNTTQIYIKNDGSIWLNSSSTRIITASNALPKNQWAHVVYKRENTTHTIYVNGLQVGSGTQSQTFPAGVYQYGISDTFGNDWFNGYLSDVYFVDGQALEPEVFGKSFEGRWGPLDSSDVKANIKRVESPSDTCPNYSEKWSDLASTDGSFQPAGPATAIFDGNISNDGGYTTPSGSYIELDFSSLSDPSGSLFPGTHTFKVLFDLSGNDFGNEWDDESGTPAETIAEEITFTATNLTRYRQTGVTSGANIMGIYVDGRLLIDGPADNSQVWSEGLSVGGPNTITLRDLSNGFDGDLTSATVGVPPDGNLQTGFYIDLDQTFTDVTSLRIQVKGTSYNDQGVYTISGTGITSVTGISSGDPGFKSFVNVPVTSTTVSDIRITSTDTSGPMIAAIEVNDELLIDGCAKWNTSQVWSDGTYTGDPTRSIYPLTQAFDGNLTTYWGYDNGQGGKIEITGAGTGVVRIFCGSTFLAQNADEYFKVNGVDVTMPLNYEWLTVPDISSIQSIEMRTGSGPGDVFNPLVTAIEVNGELLVDGGSFGTNGFYLPFDPEATGVNWSNSFVGNFESSSLGADKAFDGNLSTVAVVNPNTGASQSCTWTGSIDITTSLRFKVGKIASVTPNLLTNFGELVTPVISAGSTPDWVEFPGAAGQTLTSFTIYNEGVGTVSNTYLAAVEVDGEILVDHSSIGTDDSGNGNHFHDENFADRW